jgi:hypothetical protein
MTKLVGLALVGGAMALVAASMPEIKRYMKIREM